MSVSNDSTSSSITPEASKTEQVKESAHEAAHDVRDELSGAAADVKSQASTQIGNVKDEALTKANDLLGQAREQAATQAEQGTHQLADTLVAAGRELTSMAERSDQADGPMTSVVRQVGSRATQMGERFGSGGYKALAGDLSGFARSSPGLFLLAAAGAGFAVGRVLRNADTKAITSAARESGSDEAAAPPAVPGGMGSLAAADLGGSVTPGTGDPYPVSAATGEDSLRPSATATLREG